MSDTAKFAGPLSSTGKKVVGPVKLVGGPVKLLYIIMFKIIEKSQEAFSVW